MRVIPYAVGAALCWLAAHATALARADVAAQRARLDPVTRSVVTAVPPEWQVVNCVEVDAAQRGAIGRKLGVEIAALANAHLKLMGKPVQVNTLRCAREDDARRLRDRLVALKNGDEATCVLKGDSVVEFVCRDANQAVRGAIDLGLRPAPDKWQFRLTCRVAPVEECRDFMRWNETFNALLARGPAPNSAAADPTTAPPLEPLLSDFVFGDRLRLRAAAGCSYAFDPAPVGEPGTGGDGCVVYRFDGLPRVHGVPAIALTATLNSPEPIADSRRGSALQSLISPSAFWPSDGAEFRKRAQEIGAGAQSDRAFVDALLRWLQPNSNIRFGGEVTGSRYGAAKVLEQGFGHCWDFSDVFITLCRARGVPARQVGGWVFGGEGHVWAEVLLDGKWEQVDPTGGGFIRCTPYHLAIAVSEDGRMPLLYLEMPQIQLESAR